MVDTNALHAEIVRNGLTQAKVAEAIGICPDTFYRKMKNGTFDIKEAMSIVELLKITEPQKIFFAEKVSS